MISHKSAPPFVWGHWNLFRLSSGEQSCTPWTNHQSIKGSPNEKRDKMLFELIGTNLCHQITFWTSKSRKINGKAPTVCRANSTQDRDICNDCNPATIMLVSYSVPYKSFITTISSRKIFVGVLFSTKQLLNFMLVIWIKEHLVTEKSLSNLLLLIFCYILLQ